MINQDIGSRAADFQHQTGKYRMELLVGDSVLSNSFSWEVANVALTFSSGSAPEEVDTDHQKMYKPKPEIKVCNILEIMLQAL